jgi:hypothetical protein
MNINKNVLVGVAVALLLIIVWVSYTSEKSLAPEKTLDTQNTDTTLPTPSPTTKTSTTVAKSTNTFKSIFNQQGSHKCTFEQMSQESKTNGLVYIADGKMRGEFRTVTAYKTTVSLMVYNTGILYSWTEGMGVGTKGPLNSVSELPFVIPEDLTSGKVLGTGTNGVSWVCHDWSKDNTLLTPPSFVKFY